MTPPAARPRCAAFGTCGGCSAQQLDGAEQLRAGERLLAGHLRDLAGLEPDRYEWLPPLTGPRWNYRRKARLAVRVVPRKGGALVGFREQRGGRVTVMNDCETLAPPLARLIRPLRALLNELDARAAIPQIEVAAGEGGEASRHAEAALVVRHLQPLTRADRSLLVEFARQWNLQVYLQAAGPASVHGLHPRQGQGEGRLHYHLPEFALRFAFHPLDFVQVNAEVNRRAASLVVELLAIEAGDRVLDLFCGLGNFSLPLASRGAAVTGVEGSATMVERARGNARANGLEGQTRFFAADLHRWNSSADWASGPYDKILLDPPRSGALESVALIAASGARRLVYVSCNPESLARDARELGRRGYDLKSAGVMDMFPHTSHVESVAMFERPMERS